MGHTLPRRRGFHISLRGCFALTAIAALFLVAVDRIRLFPLIAIISLVLATPAIWLLLARRRWRKDPTAALRRTNKLVGLLEKFGLRELFTWVVGERLATELSVKSNTLFAAGRLDDALQCAEMALILDSWNPVHRANKGIVLYYLDRFGESESLLNEAVANGASEAHVHYCRIWCRIVRKAHPLALADCESALIRFPDNPELRLTLAQLSQLTGRYRESIAAYLLCIDHGSPELAAESRVQASILLSSCPDDQCRNGKLALELIQAHAQTLPETDWITESVLASSYAELGDYAAALQHAQEAERKAPPEEKPVRQARIELYQSRKPYRCDPTSCDMPKSKPGSNELSPAAPTANSARN